jgi:CDP-4-dehydro-6-deoxyglucose reductase
VKVTILQTGRVFESLATESVLSAAARVGLRLPHSCLGGNCGSCRARLRSGQIEYPRGQPLGISAAEVAAGYVLLCQARASSDLVIETRELRAANAAGLQYLPCRIEKIESEPDGSTLLYLRLPLAAEFHFVSGQFAALIDREGERLPLAIVSNPDDYRPLVLRAPADLPVRLQSGQLAAIEGPLQLA